MVRAALAYLAQGCKSLSPVRGLRLQGGSFLLPSLNLIMLQELEPRKGIAT